MPDILRARVFAIACGYEDADDLDALRDDPGFRLALGKLPGSGAGLASQPTMSRWENAPTTRELAKLMAAMIDIYGPVSNFVREVVFVHQTVNLSPKMIANWVLASNHSRGGRFHSSAA